jgi:hypothetical protein
VIGLRKEDPDLLERGMTGSLADFGVTYREVCVWCCVCGLCVWSCGA